MITQTNNKKLTNDEKRIKIINLCLDAKKLIASNKYQEAEKIYEKACRIAENVYRQTMSNKDSKTLFECYMKMAEFYKDINPNVELLQRWYQKIVYLKNCEKEDLMEQLKLNREKDLKLKTTSVGPHRDDLGFYFDGMDVRKYGSQGQQRCAALSLKLSEIELVKSTTGDTPILLLDDVLSELDKNRQNYLLNHIHDIQAMITCTGLDEFVNCRFSVDKIFKVTDGIVVSKN